MRDWKLDNLVNGKEILYLLFHSKQKKTTIHVCTCTSGGSL